MNSEGVPAAAMRPVQLALAKQRQRDPEEVLLDGCKLREFTVADAQDIKNVSETAYLLSMNQCKIRDLTNLPYLPSVEVLELQDNKLTDQSNLHLIPERLPNVSELLLSGNQIEELASLAFIMKLPKLENLELHLNPCTRKYPTYRELLFNECGTLQRIDDMKNTGTKVDSDQEDLDAERIDDQEEVQDSEQEAIEREKRRIALSEFYENDIDSDDNEDDDEDFEEQEEEGDEEMVEDYTVSNSNSNEGDIS